MVEIHPMNLITSGVAVVMLILLIGAMFAVIVARVAEWIWTMIDTWVLERKTREAWRNLKAGRMR